MPKPSSVNLPRKPAGSCRYCRCTDARACPEGCAWFDKEETVCDNERCVARFHVAMLKRARALLAIGLRKQGLKALSCYTETARIIYEMLQDLTNA